MTSTPITRVLGDNFAVMTMYQAEDMNDYECDMCIVAMHLLLVASCH